jgi:hypothetical protein
MERFEFAVEQEPQLHIYPGQPENPPCGKPFGLVTTEISPKEWTKIQRRTTKTKRNRQIEDIDRRRELVCDQGVHECQGLTKRFLRDSLGLRPVGTGWDKYSDDQELTFTDHKAMLSVLVPICNASTRLYSWVTKWVLPDDEAIQQEERDEEDEKKT